MGIVKLDKIDFALLYELKEDCRQSLKGLGRKLRQSPQALHYRINRLAKLSVISGFHTIVDSSLLGYQSFGLDMRVDGEEKEKKRLIDFLIAHKSVTLVEMLDGKSDISLTILARTTRDCQKVVLELTDNFGHILGNLEMMNVLGVRMYPRTHFIGPEGGREPRVPVCYGMAEGQVDVDDADRRILDVFSKDARMSTLEAARGTDLSAESVRRRVARLRKNKVIVAHTVSINFPAIGCQNYELLVRFKTITSEKLKQLESYCMSNPYVAFFIPLSGAYNAYVVFDARNSEHFYGMVRDFRSKVSGISDISASAVTQTLKWRTLPES